MEKLLTNAKILDFELNKLKDVHILIKDEKISKIYEKNDKINDKIENLTTIDLENNIVLSGFINSQSYLIKNFFDSFTSFENYEEFEENYNKFKNSLTEEEKYYIYKFQILNMLKNGITTFCDADFYNLSLKKAVLDTKINTVYKLGFENSISSFNENLIKKLEIQNEEYILSLNSVLFNSENNFNDIIKLSKVYNKPILCSAGKNLNDAGSVESEFNMSIISYLEQLGLLDYNHILNNSNVLDKDDCQILENYNSKLIFSPSLNLNFSFPLANIYALNKTNLIGLSSFKNDYSTEFYLTKNLEKAPYDSLNIFSNLDIYKFATINNANILGLNNVGEIKEGYKADLIVLKNNYVYENIDYILKNFDNKNIKSVFVKGKLIYNNSHFIENNDYEKLKNLCKKIIKKCQ